MQQATEVDLDRLVDYKTEYCSVIKKHKITGDNLTGLCPFHDDRANSFSVDLKTGMWHCFAEDEGGNFVTFYAKLNGLDTKEAYKQILEKYGALNEPQEKPKEKKPGLDHYTVSQYSFEKRLPEDWLKEQCCLQTKKDRNGVQYLYIPYFDAEKNLALHRKRYGGKQFRWEYGKTDRLCMYGLWQIEAIRNIGYAALVEGESDSQSMWYMGISTLGIPGASMMRADWAGVLQDLKLYIHVEPDKGGEAFLAKVTRALREGKFVGEVYKWSCRTLGCKDPSEVYMKYGKEEAAEKIRKAISNAEQIDIEEDNIPEAVEGAPVNLRQPEGWIYSEKGISVIDEKKYAPVMVCRTPIIITQRLRSMETGEEKIEVAFKRDGQWHKAIYPRSTIFTSRAITALADLGCTVTSENAKHIVKFLAALEAENIDIIKKADSTSTFGWQSGKRFVPGHDKDIVLDIDPSQRGMAAAYCQNGTMADWLKMIKPHRSRDKFRFILAASFTAPLLRIIKQRISWMSSTIMRQRKAYGMNLVLVDTGKYKDMIAGRMQKKNGSGSWMVYQGCDREYAEQVTAEHKVNVKMGNGKVKQEWQQKTSHADNHYLDCEVYATAAADILGVRTLHLNEIQENEQPKKQETTQYTPEEHWISQNEGSWV